MDSGVDSRQAFVRRRESGNATGFRCMTGHCLPLPKHPPQGETENGADSSYIHDITTMP